MELLRDVFCRSASCLLTAVQVLDAVSTSHDVGEALHQIRCTHNSHVRLCEVSVLPEHSSYRCGQVNIMDRQKAQDSRRALHGTYALAAAVDILHPRHANAGVFLA